MDAKIIAGIFIGLFLIASIATIGVIRANTEKENPEISECTECGNACTLESNCGLETCDAIKGGSCECGR
jgi:hypothetical protein